MPSDLFGRSAAFLTGRAQGPRTYRTGPRYPLVERYTAGEYTRAQALPEGSPCGRSQTPKSDRLRQPAGFLVVAARLQNSDHPTRQRALQPR